MAHSNCVENLTDGSLADHLYTYFSLTEVTKMLNKQPHPYELSLWNVSKEEYVSHINTAITLIKND